MCTTVHAWAMTASVQPITGAGDAARAERTIALWPFGTSSFFPASLGARLILMLEPLFWRAAAPGASFVPADAPFRSWRLLSSPSSSMASLL